MRTMTMRFALWSGMPLLMSLAGCQQAPQPGEAAVKDSHTAAGLPANAVKAAIEPFEMLTEQAFSSSPAELKTLIANAQASFRTAEPWLSPQQRTIATVQLKILSAAESNASRTATALASNELFRQFLEAQSTPNDPAVIAGLLDYAGFRYQALAQAEQVDWRELFRTSTFAKGEWRRLSPLINDPALRDRFGASVDGLVKQAAVRDRASALKAAVSELELVDLLETDLAAAQHQAAT